MKNYWLIALGVVATTSFANELDCENAYNTMKVNQCAALELKTAQIEMERYLEKSLEHNDYDQELVRAINQAQGEWANYLKAHCGSVYTQWRDGTVRGVMTFTCKTRLTKQRTHELWSNFLTYVDSTPPVLPEPKM